jgi:hypothetical protein
MIAIFSIETTTGSRKSTANNRKCRIQSSSQTRHRQHERVNGHQQEVNALARKMCVCA